VKEDEDVRFNCLNVLNVFLSSMLFDAHIRLDNAVVIRLTESPKA